MASRQRTNEEQMAARQSAPRPMPQIPSEAQKGALDGFVALSSPIGKEAVQKATQILLKYKEGKANLDRRIIENEQWYRLRHWECMRGNNNSDLKPVSGWLFNCIANKHADMMDNFPSPTILPREEGDKIEAEMLTSIIPIILDQNNFEQTYSGVCNKELIAGTGVYTVLWDGEMYNRLGEIAIKRVDIINLAWQPGVTDIQTSKNFFNVQLVDNDTLIAKYPQLNGKLGTSTINIGKYMYDDTIDTSDKSAVVDWYYKKLNSEGKQVLHYVKYVNDVVLYATENDEATKEKGWYEHGRYPFIFAPMFEMEGTPAGFGYIDIGKNAQEYIDRGNQAILSNMLSNTYPRYFVRNDGAVNEAEYADLTKPFVHVDGTLGQDAIAPIEGKPLSDIYVGVLNNKIDELKETTGNRDIMTGGTSGGVTASSAISAMQEAGSRLSRDANKASYRVFRQIILDVIELIRQFYTVPRCFRILGENGIAKFVQYSNAGIVPQLQGSDFGTDMGTRVPLFDVEVAAQKQSPYSKIAQNELALQLYSAGFFNPQIADQALACLDMMDFDRKDFVMQKISQNGTMYQQILLMQQQLMSLGAVVDASRGTNEVTSSLVAQFGMQNPGMTFGAVNDTDIKELDGSDEPAVTQKARQRVAESTSPN